MIDGRHCGHLLAMNLNQLYPLVVRGEGRRLYCANGASLLDGTSGGVGAAILGHGVPEIVEAMHAQALKLCHANASLTLNEPAIQLADLLIETFAPTGMEKVYFVSTGTEATELCVKLARLYHLIRGKAGKASVICRWGGYHGSSLAALSFGGRSSRRGSYYPYYFPVSHVPPVYYLRYGKGRTEQEYSEACADDLEDTIRHLGPESVSCFISEAFVNTMGACPAPPGYYNRVREICDRYDVVMILDEVVTGFGRTGANFAIDHWGVCPDLIACGKGLSAGYTPLACAIVNRNIWDALSRNPLGTTVAGYTHAANPLSTAVGLAVVNHLIANRLVERGASTGEKMFAALREALRDHPHVGDIRGRGFFAAVELVRERDTLQMYPTDLNVAEKVFEACLKEGLLVYPAHGDSDGICGDSVIIKPALTITMPELEELVGKLGNALRKVAWA